MTAQLAIALPMLSRASEPQRATLPDLDAHPEAQRRYQILKMIFEYREDPARFGDLRLTDGSKVTSETKMILYAAQVSRVSPRHIYRWLKRYKKDGIHGLADSGRADKGRSRFFERHPQAKIVIAAEILNRSSKTVAWESLMRQADRLGIPQQDLPCYATVCAWIDSNELPSPVKILAREGERALNSQCLPFLQRKYVDVPANHTWVSDHAIVDLIVRNDLFAGVPEHAQMRLRFTCMLDFRSRAVVGYCWTPEGSSRSIATAFRMGVFRYGAPSVFLADNGKDFKRFARGAEFVWQRVECPQFVQDIEWVERLGVLARLGVKIQHCRKYAPQGKHIERFFRTMHLRLESLFEHYTTGSPFTRPDQTNAAMAQHAKLMRAGKGDESPLMPASELVKMGATWIEEYSQTSHSGKGNDGRTPREIFDEGHPVELRDIPSEAALDHLFWEVAERRVDACTVRLNNQRYAGADPASVQAMFFANGSQVLLHYDPNDSERGVVTDLDRNVIARVEAEQLAPHSAAAAPMIEASMKERRRLRNAAALTITEVKRRAAELGHVGAFDALRQRSQLTAVSGDAISQSNRKPQPAEALQSAPTPASAARMFLDKGKI